MKKIACTLMFTLMFTLALAVNALAAEEKASDAVADVTVSATGKWTTIEGNSAKFSEYRDRRDGIYTGVDARLAKDGYYLDAEASDIGYMTQRYQVEGGKRGSFRFDAHFDELPHNFTNDARTVYNGIGSNRLTYPVQPPSTNVNTWNTFDYTTTRKSYGAGFGLQQLKPFFLNVKANQEQNKGIYPVGIAGFSPGNLFVEVPMPVDRTTDIFSAEAGYAKNPFFVSVSYAYSQFMDGNNSLYFRNPTNAATAGVTDTYTIAPDNNSSRLGLKGAVKLPYRSSFNFDLATTTSRSAADLLTSYVITTGLQPIALSSSVFNGKVQSDKYAFALKSNPINFLDVRLFYDSYNRQNRSDTITTTDPRLVPMVFVNDLFQYRKEKFGGEVGFRLPQNFYVTGSYTNADTHRNRVDSTRTKDNVYAGEVRWSGIDWLTARLRYERLDRSGDVDLAYDPADTSTWVRRFDAADQQKDTLKASFDLTPVADLNLSVGFKTSKATYTAVILGMDQQTDNGFDFYVDYLIAKRVKLFGSFDYQRVLLNQIANQNAIASNWNATQVNYDWAFGAGTEIYIVPKKWTLNLAYNQIKSDGTVDFSYLTALPAGRTQDNVDIGNWDSYTLHALVAKLTYQPTGSLSVTLGYAREKFDYNDAQYDGYVYKPATGYLTGAYSDASYKADIGFVQLSYRF